MAKITDKMLLKKAMEFCDEIALEDDIKGYILNQLNTTFYEVCQSFPFQHVVL